ncbi:MAG: hypothetical protein Q7J24_06600 [Desulfomicrobium sp.]|nr:hypothetical protein [Desulfomicrobium sp.]
MRTKVRYACSVVAQSAGSNLCNLEDIEIHMANDSQKIQQLRRILLLYQLVKTKPKDVLQGASGRAWC